MGGHLAQTIETRRVFTKGCTEIITCGVMYMSRCPVLAGNLDDGRLYDTLRRELNWPHMANDAYIVVANYQSGTVQGMRNRHQKEFPLFTAFGLLEFVVMDILRPLPKKFGNQHVIALTDRYAKLTWAMHAARWPRPTQ